MSVASRLAGSMRRPDLHPTQAVVVGFANAVSIGTLLLFLPLAKAGPGGATFMEASFTATSAVSVTGLPSWTRQCFGAVSGRW
jgi:hypothetical protein